MEHGLLAQCARGIEGAWLAVAARILLGPGGSPSDQIRDQLSGLISMGAVEPGERLPSVRQLASDLGVAPGTVAKAYRALEEEGLLVTRIGAGTRVSAAVETTPAHVVEAARRLAVLSMAAGVEYEDTLNILSAVWRETS